MKPEDRGLTWGDIELLVREGERTKSYPIENVIRVRCNVDAKTAKAWLSKVRPS